MANPTTKFHAFSREDTAYPSGDLSIGVSVLVPKTAEKGQTLPVLVRWHGGALINGGRMYEPWFPKWTVDLAALHTAIIVTPDYRLLPESSGLDIISDLHNFYTWLHTNLNSFLKTSFPSQTPTPDLSKILITGESAGGYMAVQSVLLGETKGVKAVIAHYPMIDLKDAWYSEPGRKVICGESPSFPDGWLDQQLKTADSAKPITERIPKEGEPDLFVATLLEGRYTEILGSDSRLFPLENLKSIKEQGETLTPIWMFHGEQDSIIPVDGTRKFVQEAQKGVEERLVPGAEHGFDDDSVGLDTDWVVEAREWLKSHWPAIVKSAAAEMARRFHKPVPRIRLTCPPEEDLFFDGPERDISTFAIGETQESSDDDEEEEDEFPVLLIEMEDQASSCHSVDYQTFVSEGRETNDNVIVNSTENEALQALLPYCPHVLTYPDSKCPLGEDCTMQQIWHSNSHRNGCSRETCKYSHDQVATCRRLFKYDHCSRQNCRYSHDQELRNTIRESIADHIDHRIFGVKDQVIEEEIRETVAGGTVNHEEISETVAVTRNQRR